MKGRTGLKVAALLGLLGALVLLSACGGGVSQSEFDAVNQQVAAKEQELAKAKQDLQAAQGGGQQAATLQQQLTAKEKELATAQQQLTVLQQQLKPAAPREPKRLEQKITIDMGETTDGMFFATPEGQKGGPFTLPAGKTVGIRFVNNGKKLHEFLFGRTVLKTAEGKLDGYQVNLFENVAADLFVYYPVSGKMAMVEIGGAAFEEIEVEPGTEVWMRMNFPAELKGEWEIACFVQEPGEKGHYEQGMKAKLIIG
jgi:uncharacterized cupredoxin-like copper-binding protein